MRVDDFIIEVYCRVDEALNNVLKTPLRKRGFQPKLSDSEVITMEIVGEYLGKDQDKAIWRYFHHHWHEWFPNLGSRANFVKQSANLWAVKQSMQFYLANEMHALSDTIHMADGFPMPVCKLTRVQQSCCFQGVASHSYCASKDEKYYGFEGHIVINTEGVICGYTFAPAHIDERDVVQDMTDDISGLLLGDKGYIRPLLKEELLNQGINLQTPLRKNMKDSRPKEEVAALVSTRRLVETVIGQLAERFHIEKVRARDLWHLSNRFVRKILAHTMGVFIGKSVLGHEALQMDLLLDIK